MPKKLALLALAHGRSGDKGDSVNIGIIARSPQWYDFLVRELDSYKVAHFLRHMAAGPVTRYELPKIHAMNFVVEGALDGGGSVGLKIDAQGKTYAHALLRYPVEVSPELFAEIEQHWNGDIPRECYYYAEVRGDRHDEDVVEESENRILSLTMNRPKRRNALTTRMLDILGEALRNSWSMPGSRDKVIILAGEGEAFCAGMDLKELRAGGNTFAAYHRVASSLHHVLRSMVVSPLPVIAAVQGSAMGGGAAIALAADIVVAEKNARFAFPETRIGFVPGLVSALAMRRMPPSAARELLLTGRTIDAARAHELGFVHHLVEYDAKGHAREIADGLVVGNSADAMARSKQLLTMSSDADLLAELQLAVNTFAGAATLPPFERGMRAFEEKKALDWSHDTRD